jgi:hypothetical protein
VISGFSQHALSQLSEALGGGGSTTTVVIDFERLADEVSRLQATASTIAQAVTNPSWAAGDEMCRRSGLALQNGWFDAAATDAQRSIDAYPYRAAPHLFLALARLHSADTAVAYESLLKAIEFGKASEPGYAATAGLLAANLAAAAGCEDDAVSVLMKARDATGSRCPDLVIATQRQRSSSSDELCQLLKDDPGAWADIPVPDSLFGGAGAAVRSGFQELVRSMVDTCNQAADFARQTAELEPDDVDFLARLYTSGSARYSGPIEALEHYRGGGCLRLLKPFAESVDAAKSAMTLSLAVHAGHVLLRYMAWRIPTRSPIGDGWLELRFAELDAQESMREPDPDVLGDGPVRDILVSDWFTIDRDVRLHDLPRMAGQAPGTGPYLRTLRACDKYRRDTGDLRPTASSLAAQPEPKGVRHRSDRQRWYDENRQKLGKIERFLAIPPPELGPLQSAITQWARITAPTGEPVVRPYTHIALPM